MASPMTSFFSRRRIAEKRKLRFLPFSLCKKVIAMFSINNNLLILFAFLLRFGAGLEKNILLIRHGCTHMNEYLGNHISFGAPHFTDVFENHKERDEYYRDSPLSPRGVQQAKELSQRAGSTIMNECDLVVTSPLTRALQTMEIGLGKHIGTDTAIIAVPQAAERLYLISDQGKSRLELQKAFPRVDFHTAFADHAMDQWWFQPSENHVEWRPTGRGQKYACPGEPQKDFENRMQSLIAWLDAREERTIALICHWGVIEFMLDMDFDNCQWKKVPFEVLLKKSTSNAVETKLC